MCGLLLRFFLGIARTHTDLSATNYMDDRMKLLFSLLIRGILQQVKEDRDPMLLPLFQQARLEVDLLLRDLIEVEMLVNHTFHEVKTDLIAFIHIHGSHKCLKRIAIDMVIVVTDLWREDNQFIQTDLQSDIVQHISLHHL